jgi:hypothetical protein
MRRTDMSEREFRVWAQERYAVPYRAMAENVDDAIRAVRNGDRRHFPVAREEGYEKSMVFEGFIHNDDMWEGEELTVEEKLAQPRSIQQLAKQALHVQDASNFYALTQSFGECMKDLYKNNVPLGEIEHHPVTHAWLSKLCALTGVDPHDVWKSDEVDDLANPTVEKELDRAVQEREAGS